MTANTKQIEARFNKAFPVIRQASLGSVKPSQFHKSRFLKAAQALRKVMQDTEKHGATAS
jgi:hypothetical protein